jgi:hypothetical protein
MYNCLLFYFAKSSSKLVFSLSNHKAEVKVHAGLGLFSRQVSLFFEKLLSAISVPEAYCLLFFFLDKTHISYKIDPNYGVDLNSGLAMAAAALSPGPSGSGKKKQISQSGPQEMLTNFETSLSLVSVSPSPNL